MHRNEDPEEIKLKLLKALSSPD